MIRRYPQFWLFIKGSGTIFSATFCMCFFWKRSLMLYSIDWPSFIVWLPLLLEIFGNMFIVIIFCPVCDVINFEINHSFLIKAFFYITKMSGQKCNYLKNKKRFLHEIKSICHHSQKDFVEVNKDKFFGR